MDTLIQARDIRPSNVLWHPSRWFGFVTGWWQCRQDYGIRPTLRGLSPQAFERMTEIVEQNRDHYSQSIRDLLVFDQMLETAYSNPYRRDEVVGLQDLQRKAEYHYTTYCASLRLAESVHKGFSRTYDQPWEPELYLEVYRNYD